jgi:transcriptional regulator with XRE-family HTH domain
MKPHEIKAARLKKCLGQAEAAARLGVSQAYVNQLEKGKRRLTSELIRRLVAVYGLPAEFLPLAEEFSLKQLDPEHLAQALGKIGYPGFAYLRSRVARKNPCEVLLTALGQDVLEARIAEALPWVALQCVPVGSDWLAEQARRFNLQNRLGFVVDLVLRITEGNPRHNTKFASLRDLRTRLEESRLAKEDSFYRRPRTDSEREWLLQNRSADAQHWNLLTDMRPEHILSLEAQESIEKNKELLRLLRNS